MAQAQAGVRGQLSTRAAYHRELVAAGRSSAPEHRALAADVEAWAHRQFRATLAHDESRAAVDARAASWCAHSARAGFTRYCVRAADRRRAAEFDARAICLMRETLAWHDGLADFAFAMQGLGSGALSLAAQPRARSSDICREVARGEAIAAFALSEPDAGSDVAAMACRRAATASTTCSTARRPGSRTAASRISTACSRAPSPARARADGTIGCAGHQRIRGRADAIRASRSRSASTCIAPHPLATLRFDELPRSGQRAHRQRRRGLQDRDADAGCVPHLGRGRRAGFRAARAG